jgi:hypothetical protein
MKASTGLGIFAVGLGASLVGLVAVGCSDDDNAPTTQADSGQPETGGPAACVDKPNCGHCANAFSSKPECSTGRAACCSNNVGGSGKSTSQIANGMQKCICADNCATECALGCGSAQTTSLTAECQACVMAKCLPEVLLCIQDVDTYDPTCKPELPGGPTDAGADGGNSDAGDDGGTDDAGDAG